MGGKQIFQYISGHEGCIHHVVRQRSLTLAYPIQHGLKDVGDFHHVLEAESAARPLDGVGRPEQGVHLFRIGGARIDRQQKRLHARQMLCGLLEEDLVELAHVYGHACLP